MSVFAGGRNYAGRGGVTLQALYIYAVLRSISTRFNDKLIE